MVTVDIWSDVMCPFCYIGKRRFEKALERFEGAVDIVWRSYQLDPSIEGGGTVQEYLMRSKGWDEEQADAAHSHVKSMAEASGVSMDPANAVLANTFDAHRLIKMACEHGLGSAAEERLFAAHFSEGLDIADHGVLAGLAVDIGLERSVVDEMLSSDGFADAVRSDIDKARSLGVRGVPFFLIDGSLAVSGAQDPEVFLSALQRAAGA